MRILGLTATLAALTIYGSAARAQESSDAALRAYTACFATVLGVTPRWSVQVDVVRDSTRMGNTYGWTVTNGTQLEARIFYNTFALERDGYPLRVAALHEVLHVVTGEIAQIAFTTDTKATAVELERLVRQMVRWPNWRGVCP